MNTKKQLAVIPPAEEPSIALMLSKVIDKGITAENVNVLGQMIGLYERVQDKQAEKDFSTALVDLQGETIRVQATKAVDVKNGVPRYTFAPFEEIMATVQPMLTRHGFSITFDTKIDDQRLTSICTLTHKSGHSRSNQFAARFSKPPGCSDAQGDMSTKSYAKRGALCDALNIVVDHDDDARMVGGSISQEKAEELMLRVRAIKADEFAFLRYAGVKVDPTYDKPFVVHDYMEIPEDRYEALDEILRRKEGKLI